VIVVVAGVAGSGKTTVGKLLAERLELPFLDADGLHSPEAVDQMARGEPLTDAQRDPWMDRVVDAATSRDPVVIACSALRRAHRRRLESIGARLFLLDAPTPVLEGRLRGRHGHFFPARLLESQLATLERPGPGEEITVVDATQPVPDVVGAIAAELEASAAS
jgi:gluconokinase